MKNGNATHLGLGEVLVPDQIDAVASVTRGEVDLAVSTAKRYPRSIDGFKKRALRLATFNQEIASECYYAIPRGGKIIEGPSVRLAEICAGAYGNCRSYSRILGADATHIVAEGVCWDLETNVTMGREFKERITRSDGTRYGDDMVTTAGNSAASKALRNAILLIIPRAYVYSIMRECKRVAAGEARTLEQNLAAMTAWFAKLGVTEKQILELLEKRSVDDIDLDDLATLRGLSTAIREGEARAQDIFGKIDLKEGRTETRPRKPDPEPKKPEAKPEPGPKTQFEGHSYSTAAGIEITPPAKPKRGKVSRVENEEMITAIEKCQTAGELEAIAPRIRGKKALASLGLKRAELAPEPDQQPEEPPHSAEAKESDEKRLADMRETVKKTQEEVREETREQPSFGFGRSVV